jgi:hypothetical protein
MTTSTLTVRTATARLHPRTWGVNEPTVDIEVPIVLPAREHKMGYYVRRADTGQDLGMVSRASDGWNAYLLNGAYYPPTEAADIMVRSTHHRSHRAGTWASGELVEVCDTRSDAVDCIVTRLVERRAEGLEDLAAAARAPFLATRPDLAG